MRDRALRRLMILGICSGVIWLAALFGIYKFFIADSMKDKAAVTKVAAENSGEPAAESEAKSANYTSLITRIENEPESITASKVNTTENSVKLELKNGKEETITYPPETNMAQTLNKAGVTTWVESPDPDQGTNILSLILLIAFVGFIIFMVIAIIKRGQQGEMGGGSKHSKNHAVQVTQSSSVRFTDVAGCDEVVEDVEECVSFIRDSDKFLKVGASMPKGIILHGPPGTGKTLIAKAIAGEAGVPFYSVSGSSFVEMFVGVGAARVRELFKSASAQPKGAIIFIDEIDAIGGKRAGANSGGNDEREQTLNELLIQISGFDNRSKVLVVAATNRLDMLDEALLRKGRLSRNISVGLPAYLGRLAILQAHTNGKPLANDIDLEALAAISNQSSGSDLAEIANEAAILTARDDRDKISQADFEEAHLRSIAGAISRDSKITEEELNTIAYHEAGHVLCSELCKTTDKAQFVSIVPRNYGSGGLALYGQRDRGLHSTQYVHEQLINVLGGRAAEQVIFGTVSSGAQNDLKQASGLARIAVEQFGFTDAGQAILDREIMTSEHARAASDRMVEKLVSDALDDAIKILESNKTKLKAFAEALLENKNLKRKDIESILGVTKPFETEHSMHYSKNRSNKRELADETTLLPDSKRVKTEEFLKRLNPKKRRGFSYFNRSKE